MNALHGFLFSSHIVVGTLALILFWIPIVARKGGINHIKFGRFYGWTMYTVAATGALMAILVLYDPLQIKGHLMNAGTDPEKFSATIRIFWGFLLFLSLITYVSVRQGFAVLLHKQNTQALRTFWHISPLVLTAIGGAIILTLGIMHSRILHIVFGLLGISLATGMLRYCLNKTPNPNQWLLEHFGGMIGSGIGAYTAFIAFGGRQLFAQAGSLQLIFWIAPGVIGSIAIFYLSRKYQPKAANNANAKLSSSPDNKT
ncbi:MAG: hypothetical protein Alis3KO_11890 [Aliiglaciecola sp.]|uniref:hypothetical protein n=1 Tax=Aliiglaciecola sp. M165 TaxID=2593649 RepID=UPI00117F99A8|nr:hypothetical protein [Aliiglaciecola sp. M165]TRY31860.1 hypothetical protein FM019_08435 [Aliiglaciecola sp. M165]